MPVSTRDRICQTALKVQTPVISNANCFCPVSFLTDDVNEVCHAVGLLFSAEMQQSNDRPPLTNRAVLGSYISY